MEELTFGFIKEGKVIRKAFADFADRVVGEVKESEEEVMGLLQSKFEKLKSEVDEIAQKIEETSNKASFKSKVENLKNALPELDGLGDFQDLHDRLTTILTDLEAYIEQNRHKNLQIKTALIEQLEPFAKSHEWKTASAAIKEIQQKWVKTGAVAEDKREEIESRFKELVSSFYERKNEFYADLYKMMEEKEKDFEKFITSAKSQLAIEDIDKLRPAIRKAKEEWKALGKIKPSKHSQYWDQFQEVIKSSLSEAKKTAKKKTSRSKDETMSLSQELLQNIEKGLSNYQQLDTARLKRDWKSIGMVKDEAFKKLSDQFHFWMAYVEERKFIDSLVAKKKKKDSDTLALSLRVGRDLLERDKRELINFEENMSKFNMGSSLDNMLTKKLEQQKRKVDVKQAILKDLRSAQNKK